VGGSWYLLQLAIGPTRWFGEMFGSAGLSREGMTGIGAYFWSSTLWELSWMLFPLTILLALGPHRLTHARVNMGPAPR
jgi:hypothetical protein